MQGTYAESLQKFSNRIIKAAGCGYSEVHKIGGSPWETLETWETFESLKKIWGRKCFFNSCDCMCWLVMKNAIIFNLYWENKQIVIK